MGTTNKKRGRRLSDMSFDEVSVVTRPANPHAKIVFSKGDDLYRLADGRIDYGAEFIMNGPGRLAELEKAMEDDTESEPDEDDEEYEDDDHEYNEGDDDEEELTPEEVAKAEVFGKAFFIEDALMAEIEERAASVISKGHSLTREQAIAKVLNDDPDLLRANRALQLLKARKRSLSEKTPWPVTPLGKDARMQDVHDTVADQQTAMAGIHELADERVADGRARTREQGVAQVVRESPELMAEWREAFRQY
jgi:hypothetical protein